MQKDDISVTVAQNIQRLMTEKGLDPAKLARASNINPTGIYDILKGKSKSPKIDTLAKIANGLQVPLATIFSGPAESALRDEMVQVFETLPRHEQVRLLQTGRAWMLDDGQT